MRAGPVGSSMIDPPTSNTLRVLRAGVPHHLEGRRDGQFGLPDAATVAGLVPLGSSSIRARSSSGWDVGRIAPFIPNHGAPRRWPAECV